MSLVTCHFCFHHRFGAVRRCFLRMRWKTLQRLANELKNEYTDIKGFSIRNMQCMMQFYNEYNKELTMCKMSASAIAQPSVAQLSQEINVDVQPITQPSVAQLTNSSFCLPITHVSWSNNLILMQKVKDMKARYWYMIQCISPIGHATI